jgi:phage-related protein
MSIGDKPLVWLHGEIRTPPFSAAARLEAGVLLRRLQRGEKLVLPHSRPMPEIGSRCHELRIQDEDATWRIVYRIDADAIVILDVFSKKSQQTPRSVIEVCRERLRRLTNSAESRYGQEEKGPSCCGWLEDRRRG